VALNQRKERTKESREIREIFARTYVALETQMKRDNTFREKKQNKKNFSRFFSLSLSRVLSSILRLGDTNLI
jgi:hypothetical protein